MVMAVFLVVVGLIVWVFPDSNVLDYGYADLNSFFSLVPYVLVFLIPAITMRSIAEERRNGTLELLLTKPLSTVDLIVGKFLANWLLVFLTILPTIIYYVSIYKLGNPAGNIDSASVFGSYTGLLMLGGVMVAIGIWTSSLNDNQIVAFVLGVFICFVWYAGFGAVATLLEDGVLAQLFNWLALDEQYRSLGRGLIDSRNVIYLGTLMVLFLTLTYWRIESLRQ